MLIPPKVLNVARCASRDASRYQLMGVYLERHGERLCSATTTDGKTLAHVRWIEELPEEFPEVEGVDPTGKACSHALIPLDQIKDIQKLAAKDPVQPILTNVAMCETPVGATVYFAGTDLDRRQRLDVKEIQGTFPDYSRALTVKNPLATVYVNPQLLIQALETIRDTVPGKRGEHVVKMEVWADSSKAIRLTEEKEVVQAIVLCMPFNLVKGQEPPAAPHATLSQEAPTPAAPARRAPRGSQAGSPPVPGQALSAGQKAAATRRRNLELAAAARGAA